MSGSSLVVLGLVLITEDLTPFILIPRPVILVNIVRDVATWHCRACLSVLFSLLELNSRLFIMFKAEVLDLA